MKTAISLPDDIFERATEHAQNIGISRSELFVKALRQYFDSRDKTKLLHEINQACAEDAADNELRSLARSNLLKAEWND